MLQLLYNLAIECWQVLGQMAPYLLFGFLMAGLLSVLIPTAWVERHLGGRGLRPVLKAAVFGVPLPLCSCSVIPVSASMHRQGASRAATTAFLLSTPQTGADCLAATYAMLGPVYAIFSPLTAFLTGLLGGALVRFFDVRDEGSPDTRSTTSRADRDGSACERGSRPARGSLWSGLRYGFTTLPKDIGVALMVGVLIAGAMTTFIPQDSLEPYIGGGILSILLLMAAGVPVYVCATASIPIAAGLIHMGASPGAALAFLISGPATNAATFTTLWKVLGRRSASLYMATVAISAIGFGLLLNAITAITGSRVPHLGGHVHGGDAAPLWSHVWAIVLLAVLAASYLSSWRKAGHGSDVTAEEKAGGAATAGERIELVVTGMTCNHCVTGVRSVLTSSPGVSTAEVDLASGRVTVQGYDLEPEVLTAAVADLGYEARIAGSAP